MASEFEVIRAMFDAKQEKDMAELKKANQELRPLIENSSRVLRGTVDVNTLIPKSGQVQ